MTANILDVLPKEQVLTPADGAAYEAALQRWSETSVRRAQYVVQPSSAAEVAKAVLFAVENKLEIAIKGGGHSCSGASASDGLVIDLGRLAAVSVDVEKSLIHAGGGALWAAVDEEAGRHGLATVGGTVQHTGVGGLTLGGGYGMLCGKHGLTIDCLVEAELVLASGEVVVCNASDHPDLFWGIRGGGSNFGPVTRFTFRAFPQPDPVWSGLLIFPPPAFDALFDAAEAWFATAGPDECANIFFGCVPPDFKPALVVLPFFNGPEPAAKTAFARFFAAGPVADLTSAMPYAAVNALQNPMATHGERKLFRATTLALPAPRAALRAAFDAYCALTTGTPEAAGSAVIIELYPPARICAVPTTATAFANRGARCNVNFVPRWRDPALDAHMLAWATAQATALRGDGPSRSYANYGFGDERARDVFGANYERLAQVKGKYDPANVFHKWFAITPALPA